MKSFARIVLISILLIPCLVLTAQEKPFIKAFVDEIAISGNQQIMAIRYSDPYRSIVDFVRVADGTLIHQADLSPHVPSFIALSPTGDRLIWTGNSGELGLYDTATESYTFVQEPGMFASYEGVYWSPTDNSLVAYLLGGAVNFLNVDTLEEVGATSVNKGWVADMAFNPDGSHVAVSYIKGNDESNFETTLVIWEDLPSLDNRFPDPITIIDDFAGASIAWSPDGNRIAAITSSGLSIYNVTANVIEVSDVMDDSGYNPAYSVSWSPDGQYIATGGRVPNIWDATSYTLVSHLRELPIATEIIWSPDLQYVYSNGKIDDGLVANPTGLTAISSLPTPNPDN